MAKADIAKLDEERRDDVTANKAFFNRAIENFRFYTGIGQWDQDTIDKLDEEGRPHLTIPLIFPIINTLLGFQILNEQDIRLLPRRGGSAAVANLGTELIKYILDESEGNDVFTETFGDGIIGGMGVIQIVKTKINDILNGELLIRKRSQFDVTFDQNTRTYNFNEKGRRVTVDDWLTKEEIELGYGVKIKDIEDATEDPRFENERQTVNDDFSDTSVDQEAPKKDIFKVHTTSWRIWRKNTYLIDIENWSRKLLSDKKKIDLARQAIEVNREQEGTTRFRIIERAGWLMHRTKYVGEIELEHVVDPWNGITDFDLVPYYPYWADGYNMGAIDGLKDLQRELNKRTSQVLHILNTTANTGWDIFSGKDKKALEDLKRNGGKSGFILDKSKFGGDATRRQPNAIPAGHEMMIARSEAMIDKASGVDPNLRGQRQGTESGKALEARFAAGATVNSIIYKNFGRTQKIVGSFLWQAITQRDIDGESLVFSKQEIINIVQERNISQFIVRDEQGNMAIDLGAFYQPSIGKYGIKVSISPSVPTVRSENLSILLDIARLYPPGPDGLSAVPVDMLLELTDIPQKEELIQRIKQIQANVQQTLQTQGQAQ